MREIKAVVTDIQRCSTHDGPGIRTTVFFKGCPLNCAWCHNPECIDPKPQTLFYPERCIGCKMCEKGCFSGAKVTAGKEMTADEIFSVILQDKDYYKNSGGVTFSGGEPLIYNEMLRSLIAMCKEKQIGTAIETSLYLFDEEILSSVDLVMADFKLFDEALHERYTGVKNGVIKENFKALDKLGVPFIVRTPVIPGVNDTPREIGAIRDFIKDFSNLSAYELLPYHPLGVSKSAALGTEQTKFEVPTKEHMEELKKYADI